MASSVYGKVYFPVRSNGLKSMGRFLGAAWTDPQASGLQSLVWRYRWERTRDERFRQSLLLYNREDCEAVRLLVARLDKIRQDAASDPTIEFASRPKRHATETGKAIHGQFERILESAEVDSHERKIHIRLNAEQETVEPRKRGAQKGHLTYQRIIPSKASQVVCVPSESTCPKGHGDLVIDEKNLARRTVLDLVFTRNGCRKTVTRYEGNRACCPRCARVYDPPALVKIGKMFGHAFQAWTVYQRVVLRLPYRLITQVTEHLFGIGLSASSGVNFLRYLADYYAPTDEANLQAILKSDFVHVDETKINIQGVDQYVWVFTGVRPAIPKTWDAKALHDMELPLVGLDKPVTHASAEYYDRIPVLTIQKGYPIYHPSKQPKGYIEGLRQKDPETVPFEPTQFQTEADWIKAGELVFHAPDTGRGPSVANAPDPDWYKGLDVPVAADGTLPGFRYVIRKKGEVTVEGANCARCHTRVIRDGSLKGTLITGAQGNFPVMGRIAQDIRARAKEKGEQAGLELARLAVTGPHMPWKPEPGKQHDRMKLDEFVAAIEGTPPGLSFRVGTGVVYVPKLPDLIGIKDRQYLDATGLMRHRSPGDLMRYAALIGGRMSGMERHMSYGDWRPFGEPPDPKSKLRYTDEQLYALVQYVYSLKPPSNPNKMEDLAQHGQALFKRERCARCHSGDTYGGSKLTPADGFKTPDNHPAADDIYEKSVGTDPNLALNTRKGTGLYRVPSLRGVWYRGPFEHNGSIATLEDWFDPRRVQPDYVPTGWKGPPGTKTRAVLGHPFGIDLSEEDRRALVAFLRTL